jgi:hypothetical protein
MNDLGDPEDRRHIVLTKASDITPRRVRWLRDERWAIGTLGLLGGREGKGKSTLVIADISAITNGAMPGEYYGEPRAVLVCATEDSWAHTIVPRLIAAEANLDLVYRVDVVSADHIHVGLSLPRDTLGIEEIVAQTGAVMLVLDPLLSRLAENLDSHKDAEVRRALEPLTMVADRCNLFVLGLVHVNKSGGGGDVLDRLMGSRAFTAVARSVSVVVDDPDDESERRRLFGTPKNNLGRSDLPSLTFTVEGAEVQTPDGPTTVGRLLWGGESATSVRDAMDRGGEDSTVRTATAEAVDWLQEYMQMYGPSVLSKDVKDAARAAGHSAKTLNTARTRLGLESRPRPNTFPRITEWCEPAVEPVASSAGRGEE